MIDAQNVRYHPRMKHGRQPNDIVYTFSQVLDEHATQEETFALTTLRPMRDVLQMRNNGLVFTLGVTNSGKTHTMQGTDANPGVIPRSLAALFQSVRNNLAPAHTFKIDDATRIPYVQVRLCLESSGHTHCYRTPVMPMLSEPHTDERLSPAQKPFGKALQARFTTHPHKDPDAHDYSSDIDPDSVYSVFASYLEIYNEKIIDLGGSPGLCMSVARHHSLYTQRRGTAPSHVSSKTPRRHTATCLTSTKSRSAMSRR